MGSAVNRDLLDRVSDRRVRGDRWGESGRATRGQDGTEETDGDSSGLGLEWYFGSCVQSK